MLNGVLSWFKRPREVEQLPELDARLALGALLVRIAKSDQRYLVEEIARIDRILSKRFSLDPVAAARMRATCEKLEAKAPDTSDFTAMVREGIDYEERLGIYDVLWQVSMADGIHRPEEHEIIIFARDALGITREDADETARRHQQ